MEKTTKGTLPAALPFAVGAAIQRKRIFEANRNRLRELASRISGWIELLREYQDANPDDAEKIEAYIRCLERRFRGAGRAEDVAEDALLLISEEIQDLLTG